MIYTRSVVHPPFRHVNIYVWSFIESINHLINISYRPKQLGISDFFHQIPTVPLPSKSRGFEVAENERAQRGEHERWGAAPHPACCSGQMTWSKKTRKKRKKNWKKKNKKNRKKKDMRTWSKRGPVPTKDMQSLLRSDHLDIRDVQCAQTRYDVIWSCAHLYLLCTSMCTHLYFQHIAQF